MNGYNKEGDSQLKALIVSDNHGNLEVLEELVNLYEEEIDLWLHCGDSEFMTSNKIWDYFQTVKGNMDIDYSLPAYHEELFDNEKILLVHGHQQRVGFTLDYLNELAKEKRADLVFYGHTHIAKVDQIKDKYFINPGSIAQPRGNFRRGSYAIYEKNKDGKWINYYDWNHEPIPELSVKLT